MEIFLREETYISTFLNVITDHNLTLVLKTQVIIITTYYYTRFKINNSLISSNSESMFQFSVAEDVLKF